MSCANEHRGAQGGAFPAPPHLPPPSEPWVPAQVLQRLEARRQQGPEAEAAAVERQMEEARESLRKAEVSRVKAEARLALLRAAGLDVDAWLAGATVGTGEETPPGMDPAEFDDYEDSDEPDEDDGPGPAARTYPYTCRVIFGYQVWPCLPGPHPAAQGWHLSLSATLSPSPAGLPGG